MSAADVVLVAATAGNGLLAGLYLGFACAVAPGLRRVEDRSYVETFRAVNAAILTPWFLVCFLGAPLATAGAAVLRGSGGVLVLVGMVAAAGAFLVTVGANVPLNQRLAAAQVGSEAERAAARHAFEEPWNRWNLVRTVLSVVAVLSLAATA